GILVVVLRLGERVLVGEDARVEDPDVDDSYAAALALGDELFTSTLFEQRVATGLHDEVDIGLADETGEHLGLVHARAPGSDDAFVAKLIEHRHRSVDRFGPKVVGVVDKSDVDLVQAQPLEGFLDRSSDAVTGVVALARLVSGHREAFVIEFARLVSRTDQTSDFRRQQEFVSRAIGQNLAEAALTQSETVMGSGIEVADALVPGLSDRSASCFIVDAPVEISDRCTAEAEVALVVQSTDDRVLDGHDRFLNP